MELGLSEQGKRVTSKGKAWEGPDCAGLVQHSEALGILF